MATNEGLTLDTLALNDGTTYTLESAEFPPPPRLTEWIRGSESDGAILARAALSENREITCRIRIEPQASMDLALAKIGALLDKLQEAERNPGGIDLTWTPADSTKTVTFKVLDGEVSDLPVSIESGWFVKAPIVTVKLTCLPFGYGSEVPSYVNEITNPSAETNTTGWGTAGSYRTNSGATLTRDTGQFHGGAASFKVVTTALDVQGIDYTTLPVIAGEPVTAAAWVKGNAGGETVRLILGDSVVGSAFGSPTALTTSWQRLSVTLTPTATGTTGLAVVQYGASVRTFFVDDCLAVRGVTTAPDYFDGATGTGYAWQGTSHASKSVGPNAVVTTLPLATVELTNIPGDVAAEGRLRVSDNATQSRRLVRWGLESRYYPASSPPGLILDSDSLVTSGFAGTGTTRTGAYDPGAAGNSVIRGTLATQPSAICGTGNQPHVGTFRVFARVYAAAASYGTCNVRLTWQDGDGPLRSNTYATPPVVNGWAEVDLGFITVSEKILGTQNWTGRIDAFSSVIGETLDVDYIYLVPAGEGHGVAQATFAYRPGSLVARDEFTSIAAGTALNGRVSPLGGTWATSGATTDFAADDAPLVTEETMKRATASDSGPRFAILGSTSTTDTEVGVSFYTTDFVGTGSAGHGAIARWTGANNHLVAYFHPDSIPNEYLPTVRIDQVVAGTRTNLARIEAPWPLDTWLSVKLVVFASGVAHALFYSGATLLATLDASSSALATLGALATGKPGLMDWNGSGVAPTRYYDDLYAATPAAEAIACYASRSIEFRHDGTQREDSTGTYWGSPSSYRGSRFVIPPAGTRNRKSRIAVVARRNDVVTTADDEIADSTTVQVSYTPRYLVIPR